MLPSSEMYLNLIEAEARGPKPKADVWYLTALPLVRNGILDEATVVSLLGPMPPRPEQTVTPKSSRTATGDDSFVGTSTVGPLQAGVGPQIRQKREFDCKYLGDFKEERDCPSCRGRVRLKFYHCDYPGISETTPSQCQNCLVYAPPPVKMTPEN